MNKCDFDKYIKSEAIHWTALTKNIKKHGLAFNARYRACVNMLQGLLEPDTKASILDIGCGDGTLFYYLRNAFPNVALSGIDGSREGIQLARSYLDKYSVRDVSLTMLDFSELQTVSSRYDVVTSLEVIEHVSDANGFLLNIRNLLKDDGHLVLSTPIRLREFPKDKDHYKEYFQTELKTLIEEAGFDVLEHIQTTPIYYLIRYFHATRFGLGKTKFFMKLYNALNILFRYNVFLQKAPQGSYELYETQFVLAKKAA